MTTTVFDPGEERSEAQMEAEARALEQGEKILQMQQEDQQRAWEQNAAANEDATLIGGKFKSQEDLLKAYNELQAKLGKPQEEVGEEPVEEQPEATEEVEEEAPEEEASASEATLTKAADEYAQGG